MLPKHSSGYTIVKNVTKTFFRLHNRQKCYQNILQATQSSKMLLKHSSCYTIFKNVSKTFFRSHNRQKCHQTLLKLHNRQKCHQNILEATQSSQNILHATQSSKMLPKHSSGYTIVKNVTKTFFLLHNR